MPRGSGWMRGRRLLVSDRNSCPPRPARHHSGCPKNTGQRRGLAGADERAGSAVELAQTGPALRNAPNELSACCLVASDVNRATAADWRACPASTPNQVDLLLRLQRRRSTHGIDDPATVRASSPPSALLDPAGVA